MAVEITMVDKTITCNTGEYMKIPPIARNSVFTTTWSECVNLIRSCNFQPDKRHPGFFDPDPDLTQQLALVYKRWSCASEIVPVCACQIEPRKRRKHLDSAFEACFSTQANGRAHPSSKGALWRTGMWVLVPFVFPLALLVITE